jgi:6-phospho-beta-glucosidase
MGLKLAVIGGGSTYTPELVDGFARRVDRVRVDEIALLDIDRECLAIVGGLAERMLARLRNDGTLPGLADDDIVEVPARIGVTGAHPIHQAPLSSGQMELVHQVKTYERLVVQAARTGDRDVARRALAANPISGGPEIAAELLDAILGANRQWLPRFFPDG